MRVIRYMSDGANQFRGGGGVRELEGVQVPTDAPLTMVHYFLLRSSEAPLMSRGVGERSIKQ
jgi:hypothetical protein